MEHREGRAALRSTLFSFLLGCLFTSAWAADSVRIPANGGSQVIAAFGLCATVTNSKTLDQFVSIKSFQAWNSFLTGGVAGVSINYEACSCLSLRRAGNTTSGIFTIDPQMNGNSVSAYCDMETDGGGWTLVARSISGGSSTSFGWTSSTGSVTNDADLYSLGAGTVGLKFTEILFGARSSGKTWGANVFKHVNIPDAFYATYSASAFSPASYPTVISGTYTAFEMARFIGRTTQTESFFFRNLASNTGSFYGLQPSGWAVYVSNADPRSGGLSGTQGMIMVR